MITDPNNPSGTYPPAQTQPGVTQPAWDDASNQINARVDAMGTKKAPINWEAARKAFETNAASGQGNSGDWINKMMSDTSSWLGNNTGAAPAPPPPTGGYDYEKVRKGWAFGGNGFASQVGEADLDKFLAENSAFTQGVTRKGDKLYDPSGRFMFDAIGNFKGGDPTQMTRIALEGNSKPKGPTTPPGPGNLPRPDFGGPISPPGPPNLPPTTGGVGGPIVPDGPTNLPPKGAPANTLLETMIRIAREQNAQDPQNPGSNTANYWDWMSRMGLI